MSAIIHNIYIYFF